MPTVRATAPVRVMDLGGWTDTWFARHGLVCSVAVGPATTVVATFGDDPTGPVDARPCRWITPDLPQVGAHPLLDAAALVAGVGGVTATISSTVPPGAGLGTSSSVLVALIAALRGGTDPLADEPLSLLAHRAETSTGAQAGVQDHVAAAVGGVLLIEVDYPHAIAHRIDVPPSSREELRRRLLTVSFGRPHHSSDLHLGVIAALEGGDAEPFMRPLRAAARDGAAALAAGDLDAYADAVRANTAGQRALHPGLVGSDACRLEELVARYGTTGVVKVNGAGGEGGSATVLLPSDPEAAAAVRSAVSSEGRWRMLDLEPAADGVRVEA